MDTIFALAVAVLGFVALDLAALRWGTDSRPTIGDDHRRFTEHRS
ncbi:MAG: hypothetical protein ACXWWR_03485 [Candidatus Limnocylindrales bacterium]